MTREAASGGSSACTARIPDTASASGPAGVSSTSTPPRS